MLICGIVSRNLWNELLKEKTLLIVAPDENGFQD